MPIGKLVEGCLGSGAEDEQLPLLVAVSLMRHFGLLLVVVPVGTSEKLRVSLSQVKATEF